MSAATPAVSVIVPTRNRQHTLERALRSVLGQTFRDFELIVVDDASADATAAVVAALGDERVRYVRLDEHHGAAKARNAGMRIARAPLLAFQDSDDLWLPDKLEKQVALLRACPPEVGLVVGAYVLFEPWGQRVIRSEALERGAGYGLDICQGVAFVTPLWLARRSAIDAAGGFDESLASSEDYELVFRLSRVCRFRAVPDIVLHKTGHLNSLSAREPLLLRGLETVYGRYPEFWKPYPDEEVRLFKTMAWLHHNAGSHGAGLRARLRALRRQPVRGALQLARGALRWPYRRLRERLERARLRGPAVMRAFARSFPRATFVQVGSNDGDKHDPLRAALLRSQWRGVMIEPVPYVFERLRKNYGNYPGITLANVAITATTGTSSMPFYHVGQAGPDEALPDWYDELGSFRKDIVLSHAAQIAGLEQRLVEIEVPCTTLPELCRRNGIRELDLLHIDAEGYDGEIVQALDLERLRPALLIYEHKHLPDAQRAACRDRLRAAGYDCFEEAADTWCVDLRARDARHATFARSWRRIRLLRRALGAPAS